MSPLEPFLLERIALPKVWGGRMLAKALGIALPPDVDVGETWELYDRPEGSSRLRGRTTTLADVMARAPEALLGRGVAPSHGGRFPLMLKFLDAREALSVQVHPDDAMAAADDDSGKNEACVVLHAAASERFADTDRDMKKATEKAGVNAQVLDATMRKLEKIVRKLTLGDKKSTWSNYSERGHYLESSLDEKQKFVRDAVASAPRRQVWDIGCNDGVFSRIASAHSDYVVAMDADPLVVDRLYNELKAENNDRILPLYVDLTDSGGGIGWRGKERPGVFDRGNPDIVMALAVIHHMAITFNVPVAAQLDMFRDLTPELIIEMPHADDPMVRKLLTNKRAGIHDDFYLDEFERLLTERFDVKSKMLLAGGTRTIFHAVRKV